jgi:hypothetical protein
MAPPCHRVKKFVPMLVPLWVVVQRRRCRRVLRCRKPWYVDEAFGSWRVETWKKRRKGMNGWSEEKCQRRDFMNRKAFFRQPFVAVKKSGDGVGRQRRRGEQG